MSILSKIVSDNVKQPHPFIIRAAVYYGLKANDIKWEARLAGEGRQHIEYYIFDAGTGAEIIFDIESGRYDNKMVATVKSDLLSPSTQKFVDNIAGFLMSIKEIVDKREKR